MPNQVAIENFVVANCSEGPMHPVWPEGPAQPPRGRRPRLNEGPTLSDLSNGRNQQNHELY
jgi:hypothetical protein